MSGDDYIKLTNYQGFLLKRLSNLVNTEISNKLNNMYGITASQWGVIVILYYHPGLTMVQIQDLIDIKVSSASGIIKRMLDNNLLIKKDSKMDKREKLLYLTAYSKELAPKLFKLADKFHKKMLNGFSVEEKHQFTDLIQRAYFNLK